MRFRRYGADRNSVPERGAFPREWRRESGCPRLTSLLTVARVRGFVEPRITARRRKIRAAPCIGLAPNPVKINIDLRAAGLRNAPVIFARIFMKNCAAAADAEQPDGETGDVYGR